MARERNIRIVGIGASAGGLEAIIGLIRNLRQEDPFAYVVLQHLSPSHRSMMAEILARETLLTVREAVHGQMLERATIYVVPSNVNASYRNASLELTSVSSKVVPKPSINQFFISLAAGQADAAIGIVLSGTGSDGSAGLRAIQCAGGVTIVQDPGSAKYDGMPVAAIDAGVADHVLAPEAMAAFLHGLHDAEAAVDGAAPEQLEPLLERLRTKLQFDFSGYKSGTLLRRIARRESATGCGSLHDYLGYIDTHADELDILARDLLISVTEFFRDRDSFDSLQRAVRQLCAGKPAGAEIRAWIAGCASGEEAYSIAMLIAEALRELHGPHRVQIFATDLDEDALNVARRGIYSETALAGVDPSWRERYFRHHAQAWEVSKTLRDMVVFARHNLVSDAPFLRLDLVSCRNVMIYFDAALQSRVLETFHFSLLRDGMLFLGKSESAGQAEQLFAPIDRRGRLFRKVGDSLPSPAPVTAARTRSPAQRRVEREEMLLAGLVRHFGLTAVLCKRDGSIVQTAGPIDGLLQFPEGGSRLAIVESVVAPLRAEVMTLMHRWQRSGKPQRGRRRVVGRTALRMMLEADGQGESFLLLFVPQPAPAADEQGTADDAAGNPALTDALAASQEQVQNLVEEMATANEEMQALNEEAQAANEELQATNEELEAANEELQATNEELVSLNEELNAKTAELSNLTAEYAHLYDSLPFPILVFDAGQHLVRFNAPAARQLELRPTALLQHVSRMRLAPEIAGLALQLGRVLAHGDREQTTIKADGQTMKLTVTPGFAGNGDIVTLVAMLIDITDMARAQAELTASQARLTAVMEHTRVIFAMKDPTGCYVYANLRFAEFFGIAADACIGKTDFALLPKELAADMWQLDMQALRSGAPTSREHELPGASGTRYLKSIHQALLGSDGAPIALMTEAEDITEVKRAEKQLRITARVFDHAGEAILVTDRDARIQTVNPAFSRITGYSQDDVAGKPTSIFKSGRQSDQFYRNMWQSLGENGYWQGEIWNRKKNGDVYPEWLTINRIDDEKGEIEHYVAVFNDISGIKDAQRKAEYLATHDALTGLINRALFHDRLRHALANARRSKSRVAVMFIDLDNFKNINDTLGHDTGDELLRLASDRLRDIVRDVDTVARLGGDEFTLLMSDCDPDTADQVAHRIANDLAASFPIRGRSLFVSASIGIAFYPEDGGDALGLIKAADSAMYRAKELGRNRVEFFKPDLHVKLLKRAALENALREALRMQRLRLVFQPKFALDQDCALAGAEALLRWTDPELGEVSPAEFIPVAESGGLIIDVDRVVFDLLLQQIAAWQKVGLDPVPIAVNVSPRSIGEAEFAGRCLERVRQEGIAPSALQVEVTEGALLDNSSSVSTNLAALSQAGIRISVDDFGTGYSSLSYLKRLPLSELKIDKSFVDGLTSDKEDEAIATAVLAMARALDLRTVAEGVETRAQLEWLQSMGCDLVQGFLLSRPLDASAFEDLLAARKGGSR